MVILELLYHRVMILQVVLGVENHSVLLDDDEYEIISLLAMMFWEVSPWVVGCCDVCGHLFCFGRLNGWEWKAIIYNNLIWHSQEASIVAASSIQTVSWQFLGFQGFYLIETHPLQLQCYCLSLKANWWTLRRRFDHPLCVNWILTQDHPRLSRTGVLTPVPQNFD
jgi:hypothetical protein